MPGAQLVVRAGFGFGKSIIQNKLLQDKRCVLVAWRAVKGRVSKEHLKNAQFTGYYNTFTATKCVKRPQIMGGM